MGSLSVISQMVAVAEDSGKKFFKRRSPVAPMEEGETEDELDGGAPAQAEDLSSVRRQGKGESIVGDEVAAMANRVAALEGVLSKQSAMLETLVAASKVAPH